MTPEEEKKEPSQGTPLEEETPEEILKEKKTRRSWIIFFAVMVALMILCYVGIMLFSVVY
jgi:predicted nucleic acid-binding Zn ribbon protein